MAQHGKALAVKAQSGREVGVGMRLHVIQGNAHPWKAMSRAYD